MFREDVFERKTSSESSEKKFREDVFERQTFRKFKKNEKFQKEISDNAKKAESFRGFFWFQQDQN